MLVTRQAIEPLLEEFSRLKYEWKFDENQGIEQLSLGFLGSHQIDMLIAYGRFRMCVDLINRLLS